MAIQGIHGTTRRYIASNVTFNASRLTDIDSIILQQDFVQHFYAGDRIHPPKRKSRECCTQETPKVFFSGTTSPD